MDELLTLFVSGQREFGARVRAVAEDQWSAPTPDSEWSVADLVAHLIDEHRWAAPLMHGLDLASAGKVVEGTRELPVDGGTGANLAEAWAEAATGSAEAFTADGALERTVELSRGTTPVREYLSEMIFDLTLHSWDLGRALSFDGDLPDDLVEFAFAQVSGWGELSSSRLFAAPVDVPDDAPTVAKLVARTGRNPN